MSYSDCPKHNEPMTEHGCSECFAETVQPGAATLRLPAYFLIDHMERSLPTPHIIRWIGKSSGGSVNARYGLVYRDDPSLSELLSDAEHYAHPAGPDNCSSGLIASAKATVRALKGD